MMATVISRMTGQFELPDEVMKNVLVLVTSIQRATLKGSLRPRNSPQAPDQTLLIESLIDEYAQKL